MTKIDLRSPNYSPHDNPFLAPTTVELQTKAKRRFVRTANSQELVDPKTGEIKAVSMVHTVEEKDDAEFVKVFADGVKATFGLGKTAGRVFQSVLDAYQNEKMTGGYADCVNLMWFNNGLNGAAIDMSEFTFRRGLKELIQKEFLRPRLPGVYWVNPALFFKGDRVAFVKEYRRRGRTSELPGAASTDTAVLEAERQLDLEYDALGGRPTK